MRILRGLVQKVHTLGPAYVSKNMHKKLLVISGC